jgi:outer membrane receptor for ferrienterochelin and colicins
MKFYLLILFFLTSAFLQAQTLQGTVVSDQDEPLIGASVVILNTSKGALTDINGRFRLEYNVGDKKVVISYVGFVSDTLGIAGLNPDPVITLQSKQLSEVVVKGSSTFIDEVQPIHTTVITEKELLKAACCNLSESFETNASVDVSFSDAITGAKQIQMLGLDGIYVQINRENIPNIRGLTSRFGLGFIPGTWIQSIDVGKGAGSVVTGYESMTGQINVELKKPGNMEKLFVNGYFNEVGRMELNLHGANQISDRLSTGLFIHGNYLNSEMDRNDDNFVDIPKSRQINILNRWKYEGDRVNSQAGINYLIEDKAGGQLGFDWNDNAATSALYGYRNTTKKTEVFGKTGILFPRKPYKGIGITYSGSYQKVDAAFGHKKYDGEEKTLHTNFIYQSIIDNSFHQFKTGFSYLYDDYKEVYNDSLFARTESVPGIFFEYSFLPSDKFTAVAGARNDFHNLYGNMFSPRIHLKYGDKTTFRLSAGRGFRVPNAIAENTGVLVSSRDIVVSEELRPEEVWNYGMTMTHQGEVLNKKMTLIMDYFYSDFTNQMVVDMDKDASKVYLSNLDGDSYAHSFQAEAAFDLTESLQTKLAYKLYDVKTTLAGKLQNVPFISRHRFFGNISYATKYDIWKFDLTGQWYGAQRLPDTSGKPTEFQLTTYSPDYFTFNSQVSRAFRWGEIYLGGENILNFRQDSPIIAANDPFGPEFDASMTWGPLMGRMIYTGFRYRID